MQITEWLLVELALLFIGLTQMSFAKNWFLTSRKRSIVFKTISFGLHEQQSTKV
jgi:hypothetical protein